MTGEKILNYKIETPKAEDSVFRSFVATHTQFSKKVLIKALKPLNDDNAKAQFTKEVKQLAQLQHPHVVTLYDSLEASEDFYIVFEYLEGQSLQEHIRKVSGPIPEAQALPLFVQILEAIYFAHQHNIMNGALNTAFILLSPKPQEIKVLDLALSNTYRLRSQAEGDLLVCASLAPEQWESQYVADPRSDVYALGIILFEMITGQKPYNQEEPEAIKAAILNKPLPRLNTLYPAASEEVQQLVNQATAKKPNERFQSVEEFLKATRQLIAQRENAQNAALNPPINKPVNAKPEPSALPPDAQKIPILPVFLLVFAGLASLMIWNYSRNMRHSATDLVFDLSNTAWIESFQDSIARAQAEEKANQDSMRLVKNEQRVEEEALYYHKIVRGENLTKIAKRFYVPLDSLLAWNGLTGKERLKAGEGIKVKVESIYKVKRGETLFSIAKKFGTSANILRDVNRLYPKPVEPGEIPEPVIFEGKDIIIPRNLKK